MRIEQFEYLVDIYYTRSITKTAEKFFISRQVVSHAVRSLEVELGTQLFFREHDDLVFTTVGKIAVEKAEKIIDAYKNFLISVGNYSNFEMEEKSEPISIYAIPRLNSTIVPYFIDKCIRENIQATFSVKMLPSDAIFERIASEVNAIGFISYQDKKKNLCYLFK